MLVMAIVPALEGASRRGLPAAARGALAGALALFFFTLFFTFSRGGTLALALALLVYFALTNERLQGALSLALTAMPVAAALYLGRHLDTLFNATTNDALRTAQGHAFGRSALVALGVAAVAQVAAAVVTGRVGLAGRRRQIVGAVVLAVAVVVVAAGGLAFASRYGGVGGVAHKIAHQFTSSDTSANPRSSGAGRLLALGSNGRIPMAREGLKSFRHHPLAGTGAGTFRFTNYLYRPNASFVVKHAHNQWINVLSELGLVGLVLFVLAIGGLLVAALRPVGRAARDADRGLLAAVQAAIVAFTFHMTIDWDWDMAAAAVAFLLLAGVAAAYVRGRRAGLAAAGEPAASADRAGRAGRVRRLAGGGHSAATPAESRGPRFGVASRVLATGLLALVALSFLPPYLSERALSRAIDLASDNRVVGGDRAGAPGPPARPARGRPAVHARPGRAAARAGERGPRHPRAGGPPAAAELLDLLRARAHAAERPGAQGRRGGGVQAGSRAQPVRRQLERRAGSRARPAGRSLSASTRPCAAPCRVRAPMVD